jgi:hypothetical protein
MESNSLSTIDGNCSEPQTSCTEPDRDAKFLAMLPRIRRQAAYYLRHLSKKDRADAVQEVVASAFVSWVRLSDRGKSDVAYAGPLARFAACQYLAGRRVGCSMNCNDVTSDYCRQKKGLFFEQLDRIDESTGEWEELVVEDRHSTPAEVASTRIDFRAWLESLPERTRHVAETLATGEATSHAARMFGCSASRVSQLRRELHDAWLAFTGEATPATSSALA